MRAQPEDSAARRRIEEDEIDAAIARERIEAIERDPEQLVSGEALDDALREIVGG